MKTEYSRLKDLVIARGYSQSDLLSAIHAQILDEFKKDFPTAPIDSVISIDEFTGFVRIYSQEKDITPEGFSQKANQIIRQTLIAKLEESDTNPQTSMTQNSMPKLRNIFRSKYSLGSLFTRFIFLSYHTLYVGFLIFLTIFIFFNLDSLQEFFDLIRGIPVTTLFLTLSIFLSPLATFIYVLYFNLHSNPQKLSRLFYIFEVPLIVILVLGLSFQISNLPILILTAPVLLFPWIVWNLDVSYESYSLKKIYLVHTVLEYMILSVGYLFLVFSFYLPILFGGFITLILNYLEDFISSPGYYSVSEKFFGLFIGIGFMGILFAITVALTILPVLLVYITWDRFTQTFKLISKYKDLNKAVTFSLTFAIIFILFLGGISYQPNKTALLNKLAQATESNNFEEKVELIKQIQGKEAEIQKIAKQSYTARNYYFYSKDTDSFAWLYQDALNFSPAAAKMIQNLFYTVAYPFVYQGHTHSPSEISQNYAYVFGHNLNEITTPKTENVYLTSREISAQVADSKLFATISIDDVYQNKTENQQEVIYEFKLPNGSVVTDLKLGPALEYQGQVAPRGAAQLTYQVELRQRRDPALMEQIGPNHYRLRVFPIPAKSDKTTLKGLAQRVKFTYVTPITPLGFSLPAYAKASNLEVDDQLITYNLDDNLNQSQNNLLTLTNPVDFCNFNAADLNINSDNYQFQITSNAQSGNFICQPNTNLYFPNFSNKRIGIFYDIAPTNLENLPTLKKLIQDQVLPEFLENNQVDVYLFNELVSPKYQLKSISDLDEIPQIRFGSGNVGYRLESLYNQYDLAVIITPHTSKIVKTTADFSKGSKKYILSQDINPNLDQTNTVGLLKNKINLVDSFSEALTYYSLEASDRILYPLWNIQINQIAQPDISTEIEDETGYYQTLANQGVRILPRPTPKADFELGFETNPDNPKAYHLAQAIFVSQLRSNLNLVDKYAKDLLHDLAKDANIVTPYSSMIALVNQNQQNTLEFNSGANNAYDEKTMVTNVPQINRIPSFNGPGSFFGTDISNIQLPSAASDNSRGISNSGSAGAFGMSQTLEVKRMGGPGVSSVFSSLVGLVPLLLIAPLLIGSVFGIFSAIRNRHKKTA